MATKLICDICGAVIDDGRPEYKPRPAITVRTYYKGYLKERMIDNYDICEDCIKRIQEEARKAREHDV